MTLALNIVVSAAKVGAGYYFRSISMIADGFHSSFDASSNILGLIGIKLSAKPPDEGHPYGHKKIETFATLGIAFLLGMTCLEILKRAYASFTSVVRPAEVSAESFGVMFFTMAVNIFVAVYEARKGREYKSDFLVADAGHTKSDIFASTSVILSLAATRLGYPVADPIAAVVIALMIARVGYGIIRTSSGILLDAARINSNEIVGICQGVPGVRRCHHVRSRGREDEIFIDLRIHVDPKLTTAEAHEIAHRVEETIKRTFGGIRDVVVHIEPE